ncbi:MAG: 6-carboxytetrahydropterin synthase QueD [Deltaproteobacteria bacterium]|nr:6-carboxytetrahydropterin synthase QueD [Deltaproteobacteria bacterium]
MYRLRVVQDFAAAHQLDGYEGACEALHGHNWKVEVEVEGQTLSDVGILIDFKQLKQIIMAELNQLDHRFLNDLPAFQDHNPSSEHLSRYIYSQLKPKLPAGIVLACVRTWESDNACAEYYE